MDTQLSATAIALPAHNYADIMALEPCFDPAERGLCARDWTGTALDVLRDERVDASDALWLVLRDGWVPAPILHEFACRCAERALSRVESPDPRSVAAIETKRAWLRGEASDEQLAAAEVAARGAAGDATRPAAWNAAAWSAAAWSAVGYAAGYTTGYAAGYATRNAAANAVRSSAWSVARDVARDAARDAERAQQRRDLIALLEGGAL